MKVTETRRLARQLAGAGATIFNDRLVNGRRSLKVLRWRLADYEQFQREAEAKGMRCEIVERRPGIMGRRYRIHVEEN